MASYLPPEEQRCGNCLFSRRVTYADGTRVLQCRHHAPRDHASAQWPTVKAVDWCGEWVPREVAAASAVAA